MDYLSTGNPLRGEDKKILPVLYLDPPHVSISTNQRLTLCMSCLFYYVTDAVVKQHPGVKIPDIQMAINKMICELRHQEKKKSKED